MVARLNDIGPVLAEAWLAELGTFVSPTAAVAAEDLAAAVPAGASVGQLARRFGDDQHTMRIELLEHNLSAPTGIARRTPDNPRPTAQSRFDLPFAQLREMSSSR